MTPEAGLFWGIITLAVVYVACLAVMKIGMVWKQVNNLMRKEGP